MNTALLLSLGCKFAAERNYKTELAFNSPFVQYLHCPKKTRQILGVTHRKANLIRCNSRAEQDAWQQQSQISHCLAKNIGSVGGSSISTSRRVGLAS